MINRDLLKRFLGFLHEYFWYVLIAFVLFGDFGWHISKLEGKSIFFFALTLYFIAGAVPKIVSFVRILFSGLAQSSKKQSITEEQS